jgi:hypothetical protein
VVHLVHQDQEVLQEQVVPQELRDLLDHLVLQGRVELVVKVILLLRQVLRMLHILMSTVREILPSHLHLHLDL